MPFWEASLPTTTIFTPYFLSEQVYAVGDIVYLITSTDFFHSSQIWFFSIWKILLMSQNIWVWLLLSAGAPCGWSQLPACTLPVWGEQAGNSAGQWCLPGFLRRVVCVIDWILGWTFRSWHFYPLLHSGITAAKRHPGTVCKLTCFGKVQLPSPLKKTFWLNNPNIKYPLKRGKRGKRERELLTCVPIWIRLTFLWPMYVVAGCLTFWFGLTDSYLFWTKIWMYDFLDNAHTATCTHIIIDWWHHLRHLLSLRCHISVSLIRGVDWQHFLKNEMWSKAKKTLISLSNAFFAQPSFFSRHSNLLLLTWYNNGPQSSTSTLN